MGSGLAVSNMERMANLPAPKIVRKPKAPASAKTPAKTPARGRSNKRLMDDDDGNVPEDVSVSTQSVLRVEYG